MSVRPRKRLCGVSLPASTVSHLLFALAATLAVPAARAESILPPPAVPLDSPAEFRAVGANWHIAGGLAGDPRREKTLTPAPGRGVLVNTPSDTAHDDLFTSWEHGDCEVDVDFLLPAGSNSGIFLQGRYEVQLFDSWGVAAPTFSDCGGIWERWDPSRGAGHEGFEGHAPLANASRAPGLWQHLHIEFRAPRFNAQGKKTENARFLKVILNGFTIHENVELTGPTRGGIGDEAPLGPLLIQGHHGPIALRALAVKRFGSEAVAVQDLALAFYSGDFDAVADYANRPPQRQASVSHFRDAVTDADGRGAAVFTGTLVIPKEGEYGFATRGGQSMRLTIDDQTVFTPNEGGPHRGTISLTAGQHPFRLDHVHGLRRNLANFQLWCEGPGIAAAPLADTSEKISRREHEAVPVEPGDRVRLQRTFTMFGGGKRLYTAAVGSPTGVHYAYDLEYATPLRVWRGGFLDAADLWVERAWPQAAEPTGPTLTLGGQPLLMMFGDGDPHWSDRPALTAKSLGYQLEPDGQPVFLYEYAGVSATDRISALADRHGLARTLHFSGKPWERSLWVLLAESSEITPQPNGAGYIVGNREYYIDYPADARLQPSVRTDGAVKQLVVHLPPDGAEHDVSYQLLW